MERADRAPVGTFYAPGAWGATVELDEAAAHHAAVKRLQVGEPVRLTSGDGRRALGVIDTLAKKRLTVAVDESTVEHVPALPHVELWAPVGDRERMLFLAEKAVELGASAWRPISYRRSRSVTPRGEGEGFRDKVRLRMIGALEQSGGAWLPSLHADASLDAALGVAGQPGLVLDAAGPPLATLAGTLRAPIAIALGPEGGLEPEERARFRDAGWRAASIGANVLRFETAGIAALALVRSLIP
ncbi:MAG TPA: RsmE family RNA methyltransferase [Gemmatimonadaceae bacterium]|nr:RsmE family RNA methyltransferase [Gemmatimonadaceae bacterium]